ncbi:MAG: epoxyqueuosine reductase QueH [Nitrospirae bacterium]|nr:epoxyqueuosine reductase QueH [Nitrospirota bacterium]
MKILLHICCANCALYPITRLKEQGYTLKGLWFNPNIHPVTEYNKRLDTLKQLQSLWNLEIMYHDKYGLIDFTRNVCGNESNRCVYCYTTRLQETAKTAKLEGMDSFSSTLLYSRYQKHDSIIEIGRTMEEKYSIKFYIEDWRAGWQKGIEMSKELNLYRQKYCGCIYSEMERYLGVQI